MPPPLPPTPSSSFSSPSTVAPPSSSHLSLDSILDEFWIAPIRLWCIDLDEELKTSTMALRNLVHLASSTGESGDGGDGDGVGAGAGSEGAADTCTTEYQRQFDELKSIIHTSSLLKPFGLPSAVAPCLPNLPAKLLAAIRASAHRLEATKKALHSLLDALHLHSDSDTHAHGRGRVRRNSEVVLGLLAAIERSGVLELPGVASTLEQVATRCAQEIFVERRAAPPHQGSYTLSPPVAVAVAPNNNQSHAATFGI